MTLTKLGPWILNGRTVIKFLDCRHRTSIATVHNGVKYFMKSHFWDFLRNSNAVWKILTGKTWEAPNSYHQRPSTQNKKHHLNFFKKWSGSLDTHLECLNMQTSSKVLSQQIVVKNCRLQGNRGQKSWKVNDVLNGWSLSWNRIQVRIQKGFDPVVLGQPSASSGSSFTKEDEYFLSSSSRLNLDKINLRAKRPFINDVASNSCVFSGHHHFGAYLTKSSLGPAFGFRRPLKNIQNWPYFRRKPIKIKVISCFIYFSGQNSGNSGKTNPSINKRI